MIRFPANAVVEIPLEDSITGFPLFDKVDRSIPASMLIAGFWIAFSPKMLHIRETPVMEFLDNLRNVLGVGNESKVEIRIISVVGFHSQDRPDGKQRNAYANSQRFPWGASG